MPEQIAPSEMHESLEADLSSLAAEVRQEAGEWGGDALSHREILRGRLAARIEREVPLPQTSPRPAPSPASPSESSRVLPDYASSTDPEIRLAVERLIESVYHDGLAKALRSARSATPFVLDIFHDALTTRFHDDLRSRGLLP